MNHTETPWRNERVFHAWVDRDTTIASADSKLTSHFLNDQVSLHFHFFLWRNDIVPNKCLVPDWTEFHARHSCISYKVNGAIETGKSQTREKCLLTWFLRINTFSSQSQCTIVFVGPLDSFRWFHTDARHSTRDRNSASRWSADPEGRCIHRKWRSFHCRRLNRWKRRRRKNIKTRLDEDMTIDMTQRNSPKHRSYGCFVIGNLNNFIDKINIAKLER